jgi:hypothetical protein
LKLALLDIVTEAPRGEAATIQDEIEAFAARGAGAVQVNSRACPLFRQERVGLLQDGHPGDFFAASAWTIFITRSKSAWTIFITSYSAAFGRP